MTNTALHHNGPTIYSYRGWTIRHERMGHFNVDHARGFAGAFGSLGDAVERVDRTEDAPHVFPMPLTDAQCERYGLALGSISYRELPGRVIGGNAHPLPVVISA